VLLCFRCRRFLVVASLTAAAAVAAPAAVPTSASSRPRQRWYRREEPSQGLWATHQEFFFLLVSPSPLCFYF